MENNKRNIKRTKKGAGATVKLVGIQIDNDLLPFLNALPNKSRFINDLLRKNFFWQIIWWFQRKSVPLHH